MFGLPHVNKWLKISFILLLLVLPVISFAQDLETDFPEIPGVKPLDTVNTSLPDLFKYVYNFSVITAGLLALYLIIWGGVKYLMSSANPGLLADAKDQIGMAFLGLLLILGSWMLVNTINPDLTGMEVILHIPDGGFKPYVSNGSVELEIPIHLILHEIPIGTLITSEYRASRFLLAKEDEDFVDIDYSDPDSVWPLQNNPGAYDTDFQGALHSSRLKRLYEVASTTLEIVTKLEEGSDAIIDLVKECKCGENCEMKGAACTPLGGDCSCSNANPCSDETIEKLEKQLAKSKYLSRAFEKFLNSSLISFDPRVEDYYDANKTDIDAVDDQEVKDLIQLLIEIENKGGYTPTQDPHERDVFNSLMELESLLIAMKEVKTTINPYNQEGYMNLLTFTQATSLEEGLGVENTIINGWKIPFGVDPNDLEIIKVKNDPATFYAIGENPFGSKNAVYAADQDDPFAIPDSVDLDKLWEEYGNIDTDFYNVQTAKSTCGRVIEIPIGRALDEAIKLTQNIQKEMLDVYIYGYAGVLKSKLLEEAAEIVKDLTCDEACFDPQCMNTDILSVIGVPPIAWCGYGVEGTPIDFNLARRVLVGDIENHCIGVTIPLMILGMNTPDTIMGEGEVVKQVENAFKKLKSEEPIGTDYICTDELGNCRDVNWDIIPEKIEEKEYTLDEKLMQVQMLLNRSRGATSYDGRKGVYELLLEDYINFELTKDYDLDPLTELKNLREDSNTNRLDLETCEISFSVAGEETKAETSRELINCDIAESMNAIDRFDMEICSPDPYLDKNYSFWATERDRYPVNCYCYYVDENTAFYDVDRFPELYSTGIDFDVKEINDSMEDFYKNRDILISDDVGFTGFNTSDIISNFQDSYTPESLYRALKKTRIQYNEFIGVGNNYYCCIE